MYRYLNTPVDNSPLIVFRVAFGLLIFLESAGAIFTGWVKRAFITPDFTFTFIGFEWLTPLPGYGMYYFYALMAVFGLMVMVGLYYRFSLAAFTLMWTATYLMQKTNYNNHYYLLILFCLIMLVLPAHRYFSLDTKRDPNNKHLFCPRWCFVLVIVQLAIVYTFASVAKINPDWLVGMPIKLWFKAKEHYPIIGPFLQKEAVAYFVAYTGILFDLLIVPLMLWRRTRYIGLVLSACFHIINSVVFQIGIFPYLMLAALVFFFEPEKVRSWFFKQKPIVEVPVQDNKWEWYALRQPIFRSLLVAYLLLQLYLPLRHWLYPGNVNWTEEGHRMAWRMMLRSKQGNIHFTIRHPESQLEEKVYPISHLTAKQAAKVATHPDMVWQFCQYLKQYYAQKGYEGIEIYAHSEVSLNGGPFGPLVKPDVDLAQLKWERFKHATWITPSPPMAY